MENVARQLRVNLEIGKKHRVPTSRMTEWAEKWTSLKPDQYPESPMMNAIAQVAFVCKLTRETCGCEACPCYNPKTGECEIMTPYEEPENWMRVIENIPVEEDDEDREPDEYEGADEAYDRQWEEV